MPESTFRCVFVEQDDQGQPRAELTHRPMDELPEGEVLIRVAYSSLNHKDALAATGHPGVARSLPLVPGIDAAGVVVDSGVFEFVEGDPVLVTGFDMGTTHSGGLAEYIRVPLDWIVPLPYDLTLLESMTLGSAGLAAAMSIDALQRHGITPERGEIAVTGASGGVGSLAISILAKLGYQVTAITGKPTAADYLRSLGAHEILDRHTFLDHPPNKPLLHARWSGAIDTVGGPPLSTLLRTARPQACITACGNTAGADLATTIHPFILRGITLVGIDSPTCPPPLRFESWERLSTIWKPTRLEQIARIVPLSDVLGEIPGLLAGRTTGRTVVEICP